MQNPIRVNRVHSWLNPLCRPLPFVGLVSFCQILSSRPCLFPGFYFGTPYAFYSPGRAQVAASRSRPPPARPTGLSPDVKRGHMSSKNLDIGSLTFHRAGPLAAFPSLPSRRLL